MLNLAEIASYHMLSLCSLLHLGKLYVRNRYMKSAKDWGWCKFITLQALFDADAGYLLNDDCTLLLLMLIR